MKAWRRLTIACIAVLFLIGIAFSGSETTSGKTANNLITIIRYHLNESTASFWSDTELLSHINDAIREIVEKTHCIESIEFFTLSSGVTEYAISSDYVYINRALYMSGVTSGTSVYSTLKRLRRQEPIYGYTNEDLEAPEFFYDSNGYLSVWPVTDDSSGNTVAAYYVPLQTALSGASSIVTPASLDDAIVYYTTAQAFIKDGRYDRSTYFMNLFRQEIGEFRQQFVYPKPDLAEEFSQ